MEVEYEDRIKRERPMKKKRTRRTTKRQEEEEEKEERGIGGEGGVQR